MSNVSGVPRFTVASTQREGGEVRPVIVRSRAEDAAKTRFTFRPPVPSVINDVSPRGRALSLASGSLSSVYDKSKLFEAMSKAIVARGPPLGTPPVPPTYALAASSASVNEGSFTNFFLTTANLASGSQVAYTLSGVSATDVQGGSLTGTATIGADGRATITVGLLADNLTEGTETLSVTAAGKTALKIINDTSTSVSPYTLVPASNIENEGYELSFTLTNMNVAIGSSYSYTLSGISSSDIQGGSLTGTATIGSDGQATIIVTVLADGLTEGTETLTVSVAGQTASTIIRDTNLFISGAGGNDALDGSELDDVLLGRNGNDTLNGGAGHDILRGGSGNDLLMGGAGDDKLWGESEADRLFGGDGNDILIGGRSTDYYDGGSGSDTIDDTSFRFSGSVSIDLALGLRNGNDGIIESFVSIENYIGSENNDSIRGDNLDNRLSGNSGDDVIFGGDGNDIISGDDGNDVLDGGDGSDTAIFSRALDQYSLTEAGDTIIVSDNILRAGYSDTLTNFELLRFSDQTIIVQDFLALLRAGVFHRGARGSID